jgi:hypothetical protein
VLYNTTTYDRRRFELFVLLSLSLPDNSRLRFLPFKGSVLGAVFSTGEVLHNDAEEKSESESDSDELEDSKVICRGGVICLRDGSKVTLDSKMVWS